jgi:hypothetical protein
VEETRHEDSDVNVKAIATFAVGLVVSGVVIHVLVWLLFMYFSNEGTNVAPLFPMAAAQATQLPPEPRLQTNPRQDLQQFRAHEDELLNGYSWMNRDAGTVRIPIDRAMQLVIERGLPARSSEAGTQK